MKLKLLGLAILLSIMSTTPLHAQGGFSNNFAFNASQQIISWDGSDPANPPYPSHMGAVSLTTTFSGGFGSAIDVPFELGYLNDGDLNPCDAITWQPKVWTTGDGTHDGDTFTQHGATTCPYFTGEWGTYQNSDHRLDGFSVDANYTRSITTRIVCGHGGCVKRTTVKDTLTGGTGTITDTLI